VDPKLLANPTGFRDIIKCLCPPNYKTMDDAVDKLLEIKYGAGGTYTSYEISKRILKEPYGEKFIQEVPRYTKEVVDCAKDICRYIFDTHGRFPAHVDAIHMPGIWIQAQHLDLEYYDKFFQGAVSETHRQHDSLWHSNR
ncbi:MAG: hypothetical protein NTV34_17350, partial [Proteobacteria bacterium]|nr:hypothetical protein [Pseudomonadota bacterium]